MKLASSVICFCFQVNQPISEIVNRTQNKQPFLIAQGTCKGAISKYSIIVDGQNIPCEDLVSSATAFEHFAHTSYFLFVEVNKYFVRINQKSFIGHFNFPHHNINTNKFEVPLRRCCSALIRLTMKI